jgi:hypothetical protein
VHRVLHRITVVLLTSDPADLAKLTEEPGRPTSEWIAAIGVQ